MRENRSRRLLALAGILGAVLLVYLGVLYNIQVNEHEEYLAKSIHSIAQEETIEASRGVITDRKGRVLVSNRSVYNLSFDSSLLKTGQDQNEAILRLLELCQDQGRTWSDSLPISVICRKPDTVYCFCFFKPKGDISSLRHRFHRFRPAGRRTGGISIKQVLNSFRIQVGIPRSRP